MNAKRRSGLAAPAARHRIAFLCGEPRIIGTAMAESGACTNCIRKPACGGGQNGCAHSDCPRFAPGDFADRPGVRHRTPRLMLAGDGVRIDLPVALMERAATTGWTAANHILKHGGSPAMRCRRSRPRAVRRCCAAWPDEKGFRKMSIG